MIDMFVDKVCCYCSNDNCSKKIEIIKEKGYTAYKCKEYRKNQDKIIPYQEPLIVTAERDYVSKKEV